MDKIERDLIVWWCPRCEMQSERMHHFCEKGPPLFPQLDVETKCEKVEVVPAEQLQRAEEENRQLRGKLAAIRCEIDACPDCADMQAAVRWYADEGTTVPLRRGQS